MTARGSRSGVDVEVGVSFVLLSGLARPVGIGIGVRIAGFDVGIDGVGVAFVLLSREDLLDMGNAGQEAAPGGRVIFACGQACSEKKD